MTEYELIDMLTETRTLFWSQLQFWSGVSFSYLVLSYVAGKHLNLLSVIVLTVLYVAFSIQTLLLFFDTWSMTKDYITDLELLFSEKESISNAAENWIGRSKDITIRAMATGIALYGTFFVSLLYLPVVYYRNGRNAN